MEISENATSITDSVNQIEGINENNEGIKCIPANQIDEGD